MLKKSWLFASLIVPLLCMMAASVTAFPADVRVSQVRTIIAHTRGVARDIRQQINECRYRLSSHPPAADCRPGYRNCDSQQVNVSVDEADAAAAALEQYANILELRLRKMERL